MADTAVWLLIELVVVTHGGGRFGGPADSEPSFRLEAFDSLAACMAEGEEPQWDAIDYLCLPMGEDILDVLEAVDAQKDRPHAD